MKIAYLVVGPESSGTKMITKALTLATGGMGDDTHFQRLDAMDLRGAPDTIVFRRSIPHAGAWVDISEIIKKLEVHGYHVQVITIDRDTEYMAKSQVKNWHAESEKMAVQKINYARGHIEKHISGRTPARLQYEYFVTDPSYRKLFFDGLDLIEPDMEYYDGNAKYANL